MLLFAITGITLNHAAKIEASPEVTHLTATLPAPVVAMLGDNLNDCKRKYYVKDVDERAKLMEEDKDQFGRKFIIFPNPTDGHWVRAIFGDSEPPATAANRETFKRAASKSAWDGK